MKLIIETKNNNKTEVVVNYLKIEEGRLFIYTPLQEQTSIKLSQIKKWEVIQ
jgi:hypothetical protein